MRVCYGVRPQSSIFRAMIDAPSDSPTTMGSPSKPSHSSAADKSSPKSPDKSSPKSPDKSSPQKMAPRRSSLRTNRPRGRETQGGKTTATDRAVSHALAAPCQPSAADDVLPRASCSKKTDMQDEEHGALDRDPDERPLRRGAATGRPGGHARGTSRVGAGGSPYHQSQAARRQALTARRTYLERQNSFGQFCLASVRKAAIEQELHKVHAWRQGYPLAPGQLMPGSEETPHKEQGSPPPTSPAAKPSRGAPATGRSASRALFASPAGKLAPRTVQPAHAHPSLSVSRMLVAPGRYYTMRSAEWASAYEIASTEAAAALARAAAAKLEAEKAAAAAAAVKSGQEGGSEPHQASTCSSGGKRTLHSELARLLETSPGMQSTKFERQFKPGDRVTAKFGAVKGGTRWFAGRVASVRCAAAIYLQSTSLLHPPTAHLLPPTKYELFSSVVLPWPQ